MTSTLRQQVDVHFEYPVYFTTDLFAPDNRALLEALIGDSHRRQRVFLVVEQALTRAFPGLLSQLEAWFAAHASCLQLAAGALVLEGGEACKNDPHFIELLLRELSARKIDRHAYVAAIGGGALQDAVGFAAAICHRGVRMVRIPTTVLSQSDAAVGVKNGVNLFGKKNFAGTFAPPFAVLNDSRFLSTLERRDAISGMAEGVKVGLVRDAEHFAWIQLHAPALHRCEPEAMAKLIRRTAELHLQHIATGGDPFEAGSARPLDFGHWAAHKLESLTQHRLRHGEAVAIGLALDSWYSARAGHLAPAALEEILRTLDALGLRLWDPALELRTADGRRAVLEGLNEFREHLGGELTVTLLAAIGRGFEVHQLNEAWIDAGCAWLAARDPRR